MVDFLKNVIEVISKLLNHSFSLYLFIGLMIGFILFQLIIKNNYGIRTFLHESSHAVMAILFLRRIERFVSTNYQGGYVRHSGGFGDEGGNVIILLAPYFFPLLTFFSLILRLAIPSELLGWSIFLTGFCISFDIQQNAVELIQNLHRNIFNFAGTNESTQSDIAKVGFFQSIIIIIILSSFLYTLSIYISLNGFSNIPGFLHSIYSTLLDIISGVASLVIKYSKILIEFIKSIIQKI